MSTKNYQALLSPFRIKQVKLKNRMVKTSQTMSLAAEGGFISDANIGFYDTLARGGVGLIIVEHTFPDYPMGISGPKPIAISDDKYIPGLGKVASTIHSYGTPCFIQFGHAGPVQRYGLAPGQAPVASSRLIRNERPYPYGLESREISIPEIEDLVPKYARAAQRAREAGFDGLELHGGHDYLLNSFLSRVWNRRDDRYGCQNLTDRSRIVVEILQAIRGAVGNDFVLGVRMNGAEFGVKNGTTNEEAQAFAKMFVAAGADYLSVTAYGFFNYDKVQYPDQLLFPEPWVPEARNVKNGFLVPLAEGIKKAVNVPVITVGRLDHALGNRIISQGRADLIGMGRRLLADPELPNKVASGKIEDIAICTADFECASRIAAGKPIRCRINASLGREREFILKPAEKKKRVVVVGGGPAGMEAARVAALRGHEVTLYDKAPKLGGLLPLAAMIKGTEVEDLPGLVSYMETQVRKLGVNLRLGEEVSAARIQEMKSDVVIVATGAKLANPPIPGIDRPNVMTSAKLHSQAKLYIKYLNPGFLNRLTRLYLPFGKKVVVIGGLIHGCEIATFLVSRGRRVTVVEASDELGTGVPEINRKRLLWWLAKNGVLLLPGVTYDEIVDEGLKIITKEGQRHLIEADTIVVATPPLPNTGLFEELKGKVPEVYLAGDAKEPRLIIDAIDDGFTIGHRI